NSPNCPNPLSGVRNMIQTATDAIETAIQVFQVRGDDYRQCFWDRIANLAHERCREPMAVDGLLCYASAIETEEEETAVAEALKAILSEMPAADRAEVRQLVADRLRWNDPQDCPRYRL